MTDRILGNTELAMFRNDLTEKSTFEDVELRNLVIVPAFNEEQSIRAVLQSLAQLPDGYEILVVNDGSCDRTFEMASAESSRISRPCNIISLSFNSGIGVTVQTGYRFAAEDGGFEHVIQVDGDGQHDAEFIVSLVNACRESHADLAIGSRFLASSSEGHKSTAIRRMGIGMLRLMIRLLTGIHFTDPTSGFRCAGPKAWSRFANIYPDDYPEPESIVWCVRNGLRVIELPVQMRDRTGGQSSIRPLRAVYYMAKVMCSLVIDRMRANEAAL